jgi:hypothetical protein
MDTKKYVSLDKLSHFLLKLRSIIPTKTSDLTNDSNYVSDANYVHTDANYTQSEKTKLAGIEAGANKTVVDSALNSTSTNPVQNKVINTALNNKVDKVSGKGLSTNDYTTAEKNKLAGIDDNANNYSLPIATASVLGGVKIGANVTINADGTISVEAMNWENINGKPTKLSQFTNDSNFITAAVNNLTNYYTKSNTYTKSEVDSLIGAIKTISIEVVSSLPAAGASNIIYLVSNGGSSPNSYDEYVWVALTSKFEKIGTTDIDLSGYWSKTELVECTNSEIEALFT